MPRRRAAGRGEDGSTGQAVEIMERDRHLSSHPQQARQQGNGVAGLDEPDVGLEVCGLEPDVGLEPCRTTRLLREVPGRSAVRLHDPRRLCCLLDRRDLGPRLPGRRHGQPDRVGRSAANGRARSSRGAAWPGYCSAITRSKSRADVSKRAVSGSRWVISTRRLGMLAREQRERRGHAAASTTDWNAASAPFRWRSCSEAARSARPVRAARALRGSVSPPGSRPRASAAPCDPTCASSCDARLLLEQGQLLRHRRRTLVKRRRRRPRGCRGAQLTQQAQSAHIQHGGLRNSFIRYSTNTVRRTSLYLNGRGSHTGAVRTTAPKSPERSPRDCRSPMPRPDTLALDRRDVALVRRWLAERRRGATPTPPPSALAGVLKDPNGLPFTVGFVDGVMRPEDPRVAARNLAPLAQDAPRSCPWYLRTADPPRRLSRRTRVPSLVDPDRAPRAAPDGRPPGRRRDATRKLGPAIAKHPRGAGARLNLNLLGEAVLGEHEAAPPARRAPHELLARRDVDYVSIKVSSTVGAALDRGRSTRPSSTSSSALDARCSSTRRPSPDAEVHQPRHGGVPRPRPDDRGLHDASSTSRSCATSRPASCCRPTCPTRWAPCCGCSAWAPSARAEGGAAIKVRVVKGANLPMERVDAVAARLAARDLEHQAGDRHQLQARPRLRAAPRAHRRRPHRRRRPQPVRPRATPGCSPASAASRRRRVRDAARHGAGPGRGRQAGRRRAPALHAGRAPARVRRRDRVPDPPARGGREPRQLHVGRVRPARRRGAVRARASSGSSPRCAALDDRRAARRTATQDRTPAGRRDRDAGSATRPTPTRRSRPTARLGARRSSRACADLAARATTCRQPRRSRTGRGAGHGRCSTAVAAGADWGALPRTPSAPRSSHRAARVLEAAPRRSRSRSWPSEAGQDHRPGATPRSARRSTSPTTTPTAAASSTTSTARRFVPSRADRRHPAVELPGRDPGRVDARRARRRLGRRHQARHAGRARCGRGHGRGAVGGRRPARGAARSCDLDEARPRPAARLATRASTGSSSPARTRRPSCSARSGPTCRCWPRRAARTRSSSPRAPTSTSPHGRRRVARSATRARSARPRPS